LQTKTGIANSQALFEYPFGPGEGVTGVFDPDNFIKVFKE
jgi:hypothetical protein